MSDLSIDQEIAAAQERAERLARRAVWSVACGAVGLALTGIYGVAAPLVLLRLLAPPSMSPALMLGLGVPSIIFLLVSGVPATVLGAGAAREGNTINRPLGVLGLVLGILCLGAAGLRLVRLLMTVFVLYF